MNKFIFHFSHHLLYLYMKRLFILLLIVLLCIPGFTQIRNDVPRYNPDSVRKELDKRPYFSLYKDNYFIGGTTIGSKPTNKNSDVKFLRLRDLSIDFSFFGTFLSRLPTVPHA